MNFHKLEIMCRQTYGVQKSIGDREIYVINFQLCVCVWI